MFLFFWFCVVTNLDIIMGCRLFLKIHEDQQNLRKSKKMYAWLAIFFFFFFFFFLFLRRCLVSYLKKLNLDKIWRKPIELNWVPYHKSSLSLLVFWSLSYYLVILKVRIWIYIKIQSWLCMNVPIGYLSNIKCNFMKSFHYHDNILKENEKFE